MNAGVYLYLKSARPDWRDGQKLVITTFLEQPNFSDRAPTGTCSGSSS